MFSLKQGLTELAISRKNRICCIVLEYGATIDLVTADGGFDFSGDFNHQENQVGLLLVSQLAWQLLFRRKEGL